LDERVQRKDVARAWDELEAMQRRGEAATRFAVSRLLMLTAGGEARHAAVGPALVQRALDLTEQFIQLNPGEADEVLFNALLDTCHRARDLPRLEKTVLRMEELRVRPSHVTLGILVKAYGHAGDATRVVNLWDRMAEERSQANAVTCGCMIDACVKCGRLEKALEIFRDMKTGKKHRNTILYTTLIKGCGLKKDLRQALALFREMKTERVPYNRITYNSVIDVCIKCVDVPAAENIFAEMTAPGSGIVPDHITYSTLLKGYCHMGDLDKALQVAATIKANGLPCDEMVYNSLVDGCVRAGDLSAGIGLFAEMIRSGVQPSAITHGILVRLYQKSSSAVDACEAVAQLYMHHALPRPDAALEQRSKRTGGGRRGKRQQKAATVAAAPPPLPQAAQQPVQLDLHAAMLQASPPALTMALPAATMAWTGGAQSQLPQLHQVFGPAATPCGLQPHNAAGMPSMPTFPARATQVLQETGGFFLQHGFSPQQFLQQPGEQAQQVPDASQRMLPQSTAGMPSMPMFPASASQVIQETSGLLLQHGFCPQQFLQQPGEQAQQLPDASQRMLPQNAAGMPSMPTFPASASQVLQETGGLFMQHGLSPQQLLPQPTSPWPVALEEATKVAEQAQQMTDASQRMLPQHAAAMPSMPTFPASASQVLQETSGLLLQHGFSPQQFLQQPSPSWTVAPEDATKAAEQAQQVQMQASAATEVRRQAGLHGGPASWGGM
jgi:pentatricopeptide repeat protein